MGYVIGIDLGTASVKALVAEMPVARVLAVQQVNYGYAVKDSVRAEQDPCLLLECTVSAMREVLRAAGIEGSTVVAVGLSGQMHGTVLYDKNRSVLGNIITWEDQRVSLELLDEMRRVGGDSLERSGCGLATGYCGMTLFSLKQDDKSFYSRVKHMVLPTDWLRRELTGCGFYTDTSNGSSSGLFDIRRGRWNVPAVTRLGLDPELLPEVKETFEVGGRVRRAIARRTGLKEGTPVTVGGGDQPLSMIGSGICLPEDGIIINIGTGGQVATVSKRYRRDKELITFCFPGGGYSVLGATLSAGAALRWWEKVLGEYLRKGGGVARGAGGGYEAMSRAAGNAEPGAGGVCFVPVLTGTRTQPNRTGAFCGLKASAGLAEMTRAVMEGVSFELYHLYRRLRLRQKRTIVGSGGGFSSRVWSRLVADIFGSPIRRTACQEQAALGAALVAGVMIGTYGTLKEACAHVRFKPGRIRPKLERVKVYKRVWRDQYRDMF